MPQEDWREQVRLLTMEEFKNLQGDYPYRRRLYRSMCPAGQCMVETYADPELWNRMSLHNIARSGIFAADRAIAQYADNIWHVPHK